MESKLNHSFIQDYSSQYIQPITDDFFKENKIMSGQQLLGLCPVKQVNLFVAKKLFENWQQETHKLKSPYFDYEATEVKAALQTFMNTLSQHISISRTDFEPLLKQAVSDTILLIFSPYDYYVQAFNTPEKDSLTLEALRKDLRYTKINRPILEALVRRFEDEQLTEVQGEKKNQLFNEVFENLEDDPEDFDDYIRLFSETHPLSVEKLYAETESPYSTQNGQHEEERPTLNDQFSVANGNTLADLHQNKKIDSIRKHINVNQRYMFTKSLFGDNTTEFEKAIEDLDTYSSYVDAFNYLRKDFASKYRWKMDSEEVIEFLEIVAKKY
jgi:hypothetical protein